MQVPELNTDTLSSNRDGITHYLYGVLPDIVDTSCSLFLWIPLQEAVKPINIYTIHLDWGKLCSNFCNDGFLNGYVTCAPKEVHVGNSLVNLAIDYEGHNILLLDKGTGKALTPAELQLLSTHP